MERTMETRSIKEEIKGTQEYIEKYFPVVKASILSLEDPFLKHEAETENQIKFKKMLEDAIKSGLSDFRAQRMDPSLDEDGNICYKAGMKPTVNKSSNWWKENAEKFMPEKDSKLGSTKQRIAFVALFIKYLIEQREFPVESAWKLVCDQSDYIGHYWDSDDAKRTLEPTGSRKEGDWYDLGNVFKITFDDETEFSFVGGVYCNFSDVYPLACVRPDEYPFLDSLNATGWIVLSV